MYRERKQRIRTSVLMPASRQVSPHATIRATRQFAADVLFECVAVSLLRDRNWRPEGGE